MIKILLINLYERLYYLNQIIILRTKYRLRILDSKKTIKYILRNKCSIARFGDGEFNHIFNIRDEGYQKRSEALSQKLSEVFDNHSKDLLICIPRYMNTTRLCTPKAKEFWITWGLIDDKQKKVVNFIKCKTHNAYQFGDSLITRPYIDLKSKTYAKKIFPLLKQLWFNRDILIVEGTQTRMGVGNDLFQDAGSIKRILAPAVGAFEHYDEIYTSIIRNYNGELVLLALGPTATILASELSNNSIQALDLGHIDIEYEWYIRGAINKTKIQGKYVNEVPEQGTITECNDLTYLSQIIDRIESNVN